MGEAGGPTKVRRRQSAFLWRLDTVSLGKHQRNGVERQGRPTTTTQSNGAHAQAQRTKKRGNPRRGFPLGPPPALYEAQGGSARCGGRPGTLSLDPATFEKVDETFIRARCAQGVFTPRPGPSWRRRLSGSLPRWRRPSGRPACRPPPRRRRPRGRCSS